jgi:hypothetical protein
VLKVTKHLVFLTEVILINKAYTLKAGVVAITFDP